MLSYSYSYSYNDNIEEIVKHLKLLMNALAVKVVAKTELSVIATCYLWDRKGNFEVSFDCIEWLENAKDEELIVLSVCGEAGNPAIGEYYRTTVTRELRGSTNTKVNQSPLYKWVQRNRPHLLKNVDVEL